MLRGDLPAQFCVKCEGSNVKAVIIEPRDTRKPTRYFAVCLDTVCMHMRELDESVTL